MDVIFYHSSKIFVNKELYHAFTNLNKIEALLRFIPSFPSPVASATSGTAASVLRVPHTCYIEPSAMTIRVDPFWPDAS